jgi:hypothetical protein
LQDQLLGLGILILLNQQISSVKFCKISQARIGVLNDDSLVPISEVALCLSLRLLGPEIA